MNQSINSQGKYLGKITNFSLINAIYSLGIGKLFELNPTSLLVLIGLASHFNPNKSIVFPSQEYLADHLNISERSVIRAIKDLLAKNLVFKSKNGNSNVYCFTNIFFEAVKMSDDRCQNVGNTGDKMSAKHDNKNMKNNIISFQKNQEGISYPGIEATKELLEEKNRVKTGSPLDYSFEEAIEFLNNLIPELKNSYFAKELRKKWSL